MVTNTGPASAINVVTVLERIEPLYANPLLREVAPTGAAATGICGINVLPSRLLRKAQGYLPPRCDINVDDREYFDVLTFRRDEGHAYVAFQIAEMAELASHVQVQPDQMWFPIDWVLVHELHIRVTAANAAPVERVFYFRAVNTPGDFLRFSSQPLH